MALKTCMSVAFWKIELDCDVYNLQNWINNNIFLMSLVATNFVIFYTGPLFILYFQIYSSVL